MGGAHGASGRPGLAGRIIHLGAGHGQAEIVATHHKHAAISRRTAAATRRALAMLPVGVQVAVVGS